MLSNNAYTQEYFDIMESLGGDIESRRTAKKVGKQASDKESRNCRRGKVRKYAEKLRDPKLDRSKADRQEHHRQHAVDHRLVEQI